jgi:lysophospholipase L1-like esterase
MASFLLTQPLALVQGLWVLAVTPRLAPARGTEGRLGDGPDAPLQVIGVGDSIIAGTGVSDQREALTGQFAHHLGGCSGRPVRWRVYGRNGATSSLVRQKIAPQVGPANCYLLSIGVNDAVRGTSPAAFAGDLRAVVGCLFRQSPAATIILAGIPPLASFPALPMRLGQVLGGNARALQRAMKCVARENARVVHYEFPAVVARDGFARDGFHPGPAACALWARHLVELWLSADLSVDRAVLAAPSQPGSRPSAAGQSRS